MTEEKERVMVIGFKCEGCGHDALVWGANVINEQTGVRPLCGKDADASDFAEFLEDRTVYASAFSTYCIRGWCAGFTFGDMVSASDLGDPEWRQGLDEHMEHCGMDGIPQTGFFDVGPFWALQFYEDMSVVFFNKTWCEDEEEFRTNGEWIALNGADAEEVQSLADRFEPVWAHETVEEHGTDGGGGFRTMAIGGGGANGWASVGQCEECDKWREFLFRGKDLRGEESHVCFDCAAAVLEM